MCCGYRKQITRKLRTLYFKGIHYSNPMTFKSRLRALKVIETGTIRKIGYGFLFTYHSTYGRIFSHFGDIQRQRVA